MTPQPDKVGLVRARLLGLIRRRQPASLVCSAACGADLLALDAAGAMNLRRRTVLPLDRAVFRQTSVVDRPGDWGPLCDRVIEEVEAAGDLVVLQGSGNGGSAYTAANERILDEALSLAYATSAVPVGPIGPDKAVAVIVWEGQSRGPDDLTERFAALARSRGLSVEEISTR